MLSLVLPKVALAIGSEALNLTGGLILGLLQSAGLLLAGLLDLCFG